MILVLDFLVVLLFDEVEKIDGDIIVMVVFFDL